ncbi:endo alpha-1,4 polygalactosaminidase [Herbiconiux liukaitaii]|uniref:endo alpha-1,4 polygalactosaminidase n=1 Tax=Herbiconiux liukaitaii TaxID=3342799 RepID=UPI0035BAA109
MRRGALVPLAATTLALVLTGCAASGVGQAGVAPLPADAVVDYQLGGAYPPPDGVTVVARDSTDEPAEGIYSICYVNGFQTQPGADWPSELVLHDASGAEVFDPGWPDERLLDIRTAENRERAAAEIGRAIEGCADDGFEAVEFDNLDSYTRSGGAFGLEEAVAFATLLVDRAHASGLAAGQKNTPQLGERGRDDVDFDFAVAEECVHYEECGAYTDAYGQQVIDIEYEGSIEQICTDPERPAGTVLRDRDLTPAGDPAHVYEHC